VAEIDFAYFTCRQARGVFGGKRLASLAVRRRPEPHVTVRYPERDFAAVFVRALAGLQPGGPDEDRCRGRELEHPAADAPPGDGTRCPWRCAYLYRPALAGCRVVPRSRPAGGLGHREGCPGGYGRHVLRPGCRRLGTTRAHPRAAAAQMARLTAGCPGMGSGGRGWPVSPGQRGPQPACRHRGDGRGDQPGGAAFRGEARP
jgi:hypothetical protein